MNNPATTLRAARELLSDEARWCDYPQAASASGTRVWHSDQHAVKWSLIGAVLHVSDNGFDCTRAQSLLRACTGADLGEWGSEHCKTYAGAMRVLDAAIARAEGKT